MTHTTPQAQAGQAYRQTAAAIRAELDTLHAQLTAHAMLAAAEGMHWGHVGDLTAMLDALTRLTHPQA